MVCRAGRQLRCVVCGAAAHGVVRHNFVRARRTGRRLDATPRAALGRGERRRRGAALGAGDSWRGAWRGGYGAGAGPGRRHWAVDRRGALCGGPDRADVHVRRGADRRGAGADPGDDLVVLAERSGVGQLPVGGHRGGEFARQRVAPGADQEGREPAPVAGLCRCYWRIDQLWTGRHFYRPDGVGRGLYLVGGLG